MTMTYSSAVRSARLINRLVSITNEIENIAQEFSSMNVRLVLSITPDGKINIDFADDIRIRNDSYRDSQLLFSP